MSLGLRSTKIRSKNGEVYFIPNGTINQSCKLLINVQFGIGRVTYKKSMSLLK